MARAAPTPSLSGPRAIVPGLLSAVTFGLATPLSKDVFEGVSALFAAGWLYLASGSALAIVVAARLTLRKGTVRGDEPSGRLTRADLPWLAAVVVSGGLVAPYAFVRALETSPAQQVAVLLPLEIVFAAAIAVTCFGERLSPLRWAGIAAIVVGGVICTTETGTAAEGEVGAPPLEGVLWTVVACLGWAADGNLMRRLVHRDSVRVAAARGLIAGPLALALWALLVPGASAPTARTLWGGAAIGVVSYGLSVVLYLESLRRIETSRTAALFGTAPFVGVLLSWAWLGERPTLSLALAGLAMALGVVLLGMGRPLRERLRRDGADPAGPSVPPPGA